MQVDKDYCMASYLQFRFILDPNKTFKAGVIPTNFQIAGPFYRINAADDVAAAIDDYIAPLFGDYSRTALMLSGGIDSAILAAKVPRGTKAYTFRSDLPGTVDESPIAREYAEQFGLDHEIIELGWHDFLEFTPILMRAKGAPIHSIAVQIYKAAVTARAAGFTNLLFGESADILFGGFDGLLGRDYTTAQFIDRYCFVNPEQVLVGGKIIDAPFVQYTMDNGIVDVDRFCKDVFFREACDCYNVACETAGIHFASPYTKMRPAMPLDIARIRSGDTKYFVREVFRKLYPNYQARTKIPMPRAVDQYLSNWQGPKRPEFKAGLSMDSFTGDQKWYLWCLEQFLAGLDSGLA